MIKRLICQDCYNSRSFMREAIYCVEFSTKEEMNNKECQFEEWNGDLVCSECGSANVEEISSIGQDKKYVLGNKQSFDITFNSREEIFKHLAIFEVYGDINNEQNFDMEFYSRPENVVYYEEALKKGNKDLAGVITAILENKDYECEVSDNFIKVINER